MTEARGSGLVWASSPRSALLPLRWGPGVARVRSISPSPPAKTVADLFRYRRKLGIDVAIEALREGWRERLFTVDEIERYADICSVNIVIRPYLRAIAASA